ncbi:hypothetical protein BDN70DRAFT_624200 [Pholiota conissans]|uniref:Uncharacterized protein n=1 Tax=Pholiota conissans TaxID=109636 RepID=A0A9P5Z314_9AGAR|nr:hypothetical protein BDN70DRAFT_624200 [Pholiota conissans]
MSFLRKPPILYLCYFSRLSRDVGWFLPTNDGKLGERLKDRSGARELTASAPPLLLAPEHLRPIMTHPPDRLLHYDGVACSISSPLAAPLCRCHCKTITTPLPSRQVSPSILGACTLPRHRDKPVSRYR